MPPITHYLYLAFTLFFVGLAGAVFRRSLLHAMMGVALMLAGVALMFTAYARYHLDVGGQAIAMIVLLAGLVELSIGAAVALRVARADPRGAEALRDWPQIGDQEH